MTRSVKPFITAALLVGLCCVTTTAPAESIATIRQTFADGANVTEVTGIVVLDMDHMNYHMGRLHLQDIDGGLYSGITLVDLAGAEGAMVQSLQVGDQVTLHNVQFADRGWVGNDVLYYDSTTASFEMSRLGILPAVTVIAATDIPVGPISGTGDAYQSMRLQIDHVMITDMGLGKADDCYVLTDRDGNSIWAADYANPDKEYDGIWWSTKYHHFTSPDNPADPFFDAANPINNDGYGGVGQAFESVSGILEWYRNDPIDAAQDYCQLITTGSDCFQIPEPTTMTLLLIGMAIVGLRSYRRRSVR